MRRGFDVLVGIMLVGAAAVAGCSPSSGTTTPAEPVVLELPPRPREVRVDGIDPCSLLTEQQRADLGLEPGGGPFVNETLLFGEPVPSCLFMGESPRATTVAVTVVTVTGIERFTGGELDADVQPLTVQGFPGVVTVPRRYNDYCDVVLDVAPGQLVDVQYGDVALPPPISQDQLCRDAEQVANAVMVSLLHG